MNTLAPPVQAVPAPALPRLVSALTGLILLAALTGLSVLSAGVASAAPTSEFTFSPQTPSVGQPVTFRFTGTCDIPPCSVDWTWFKPGGSSLGTNMGEGEVITYAFPAVGTYSVVADITNAGSTHGSARATHAVVVRDRFEDFDRQVGYDGWRGAVDSTASAGGFRFTSVPGSVASFAFTGTAVTWTARTGPSAGIASVSVDGVAEPPVDLYSRTRGTKSVLVSGLADAAHRIRVQATGTKNPAATGAVVSVDDFVVGATRTDDRSNIAYDSWTFASSASASGRTVRNSSTTGASTALGFYGTSVTWLSFSGPRQGLADVLIDGRRVATVDGYAAANAWQVPHTFGDLPLGSHTIRIVVLGAHNANSTGNRVTSDAFVLK